MNQRFTLDVPSFQKLLEAAWVLQCERDREVSESRMIELHSIESHLIESPAEVTVFAVSSNKDERNTALALPLPSDIFKPARAVAEAHTPQMCEGVDPSFVPGRLGVAPNYQQAEVAGALALAADRYGSPLGDPVPLPAPFEEAAGREGVGIQMSRQVSFHLVRSGDKYRVALRLVPVTDTYQDKKHALAMRTASALKRASRISTTYAGPVVVLAIMLAFVFSLLGIHGPALTAVKAAALAPRIAGADSPAADDVGQTQAAAATGSGNIGTIPVFKPPALETPSPESTVLEPSHLRVTDAGAWSRVEGLSLYEMQTLSRQAEYGDDVAALTLGMAYETGRNVPQSCAQAAHWVAVAAEAGNAAAQYNLALRYVSGDGLPTNVDEARKWFKEAASHGYEKARLVLQNSSL